MKPLIAATTYDSETYRRIARAIAFMRQTYRDQPDLATVAQHVHLSESHFQRLFTQWAGISPKRFWQYLTVEYAKSKIAETKSLLDLTVEMGLSSPGRLHDLFVKLEAMSPGEFKAGGAGLQIQYGLYPSPFGDCLIATTTRGICNLHFLDSFDQTTAEPLLRLEWPKADLVLDHSAIQAIGDRIFAPTVTPSQPLHLFVKGTNFQIQVWRALLNLPPGGMATYQGLAHAIGRTTAARAIGNAVGRNPVGYLIPCHRVIRESGELGGYRWGLERKTALLGWEASRCER
jgi:AraC family transcriptional regulator, regulatory protein of adaptative response / methylated-DNA-[protein]-cysteine methyltransferase